MSNLLKKTNLFWQRTGFSFSWEDCDIASVVFDPLCFPEFDELQKMCISLINTQLSNKEIDAFLFCMALDAEDECILDACKAQANTEFIHLLLSKGTTCVHSDARWQMTELLRRNVPNKQYFLQILLSDTNPYVRKRASNVAQQ